MNHPIPTLSTDSVFFTVDDLCLRWKCHFQTVRGFIRRGTLKPTRIGRCIRISRQEIERFEAESTAA